MSSYTKTLGDIGVSVVTSELLKHGINVLLPYDDNSSYDIVIYINDSFYKIQVKTTEQIIDGCMIFSTCKSNPYQKINTLYTENEVDYFALYCLENNWCGWIKNENISRETRLRIEEPKNNQFHNIKFANDYEIHKQIVKYYNQDLLSNKIIHKVKKKYKRVRKKIPCPICNEKLIETKSNMCRACYLKSRK